MIQRQSIILWKKAEQKSFEKTAEEAFEVLSVLKNYPEFLRPNYIKAYSKKDVKSFSFEYDVFKSLLKEGVNRNKNIVFEKLGYSVAFFSSFNEMDASSFDLHVGTTDPKFINTCIMNLPLSYNYYDEEKAKMIYELFCDLVKAFRPFWGCVSNTILSREFQPFLDDIKPSTVHWINYWSEKIQQAVGMEKINEFVHNNKTVYFNKGVLSINKTALNVENEADMLLHKKLHMDLFKKEVH